MQRIFITGISGFLGITLADIFYDHSNEYTIQGQYNNYKAFPDEMPHLDALKLDITDMDRLRDVIIKFEPDMILHCAALRDLSYCETHPNEAEHVNVTGTENIVQLCDELGLKLVLLSTDLVFSGEEIRYVEASETEPLNKYAETKVACEKLVRRRLQSDQWLIVRVSVLFGIHRLLRRADFVKFILNRLRKNQEVKVFYDKYRNVTHVSWAAKAIKMLIDSGAVGVYHVCGDECINYQEWSEMIAAEFELSPELLVPVPLTDFKSSFVNPKKIQMDNSKLRQTIGSGAMMPSIRMVLQKLKTESNYLD